MVSFNVYKSTAAGIYVEGVCLISDEKPVAGIANGSILFAVDPSDGGMIRYMFNQSSASWVETTCPGSGGGGSISDFVFDMKFTVDLSDPDNLTATCDKTFAQYVAAHEAGKIIRAVAEGMIENTGVPFSEYSYAFSGPTLVTPGGTFIGPVQWGDNNGTEYLWWPGITFTEDAVFLEKWTYPTLDD